MHEYKPKFTWQSIGILLLATIICMTIMSAIKIMGCDQQQKGESSGQYMEGLNE